MLPEFSKKFESGYRSFFRVWVVLWAIFNIGQFLFNLVNYAQISNDPAKLRIWLFNSIGSFIGLALGILLLFILNSVPEIIAKRKALTNVGIIMVTGVVYFLFPTFVNTVGNSLFYPSQFIKWFPSASLSILGLHIIYCLNLNKYNESLTIQ